MSDEEPDFMSDVFLVEDTRPSLLFSHKQRRDHETQKRKSATKRVRPKSELEHEARTEGLAKRVDDGSNKGYAMLLKMGYKPGSGLGRSGKGRSDPVPLEIKTDRGGLGRDAQLRHVQAKRRELMKLRESKKQQMLVDFRASMANRKRKNLVLVDLEKSKKTCRQLELKLDQKEPIVKWFWPIEEKDEDLEQAIDEEDEKSNEPELEPEEQLVLLTSHLRENYFYCVWCGLAYADQQDLGDNCPGETRGDHDD